MTWSDLIFRKLHWSGFSSGQLKNLQPVLSERDLLQGVKQFRDLEGFKKLAVIWASGNNNCTSHIVFLAGQRTAVFVVTMSYSRMIRRWSHPGQLLNEEALLLPGLGLGNQKVRGQTDIRVIFLKSGWTSSLLGMLYKVQLLGLHFQRLYLIDFKQGWVIV